MRGYPQYNFPAFDEARDKLRGYDCEVVSPADLDREIGFDPTKTLGEQRFSTTAAIQRDIRASLDCDCAVVLPGWEFSRGAGVEVMLMRFLGRPVSRWEDVDFGASQVAFPSDPQAPLRGMAVGWWGQRSETFRDAWNGRQGERQQAIAREAFKALQHVSVDVAELLLRKNADYGDSVFNPPRLAPHLDAMDAVLVRMSDKIARLRSLSEQDAKVEDESVDDTFRDLIGYCLLWLVANSKEGA